MRCPRCPGELVEDDGYWVCVHGYFIPFSELESRFGPTLRRLMKSSAEEPGPPCPACANNLWVHQSLGMEVDVCPGCRGLWLDGNERAYMGSPPMEGRDKFWGMVDVVLRALHAAYR